MLFISSDDTIINTSPQNPYYQKALIIRDLWISKQENFTIQTSGSTGTPKQINISRKQILASIRQTQKAFQLQEGDTAFCCLNINYIAGMMMIFRATEIGMDLVVVEPTSNPFNDLGNQQYLLQSSNRRNFFAFVPLQLEQIFQEDSSLLHTAKAIIVGGAKVNEQILEKIQSIASPTYATYGMTETVSHVAIQRLNGLDKQDYFEVLEGVEVGQDSKGCLTIKGEVTDNQLLITNDLIEIFDARKFRLLGRVDNVINSGGIKIQLEAVENKISEILDKIPFRKRLFCIGMPDEKLGQKLILAIEAKRTNEDELKITEILNKNLPKFEIPKQIFWIEKFIETPTQKVDKKATVDVFIHN